MAGVQRQNNPVAVNEHLLIPTTGGLRLACKLFSVAGKPLEEHEVKVICYPGWLDNSGSFDIPAEILCRDYGFALCCVDPPGCGLSDWRPESAIYNDFEEVPMIADIADDLGWEEVVLMGHSRGGGISALAAGLLRKRVKAFVCIDSYFALSGMWLRDLLVPRPRAVKQMRRAREMAKKNLTRKARVWATFEEAVEANMTNQWFEKKEETARNIVKRHLRPVKGGFTFTHDVRTYGQLQYMHVGTEVLEDFIRSITAPTIMIVDGSRWKALSVGMEDILQDSIDRNTWLKIPPKVVNMDGKGHHMHSDEARDFCDIVAPFILEQYSRPHLPVESSTKPNAAAVSKL